MLTDDATVFDEALYLALNPDVRRACASGTVGSGSSHWSAAGRRETELGLRPSLATEATAAGAPIARRAGSSLAAAAERADGLDAAAYLAAHPDLSRAFGSDQAAARRHWVEDGILEGRAGPGATPHAGRRVCVGSILARPFGVDLHLAAGGSGLLAGRHLLAALRQAGIAVSLRPFAIVDDHARITSEDAATPCVFRIAMLVAPPAQIRELVRLYPEHHFDRSYVIAFWDRHAPEVEYAAYPIFGAIDEVWVPDSSLRARISSVAPVPVRWVDLPALPLVDRKVARKRLGLARTATCVLGDPGRDGPVADAIAALAGVQYGSATHTLVLRIPAETAASTLRDLALSPAGLDVVAVSDRRDPWGRSLALAACDVLIDGPGYAIERIDACAAGIDVIGNRAEPDDPSEIGEPIGAMLSRLGLDVPVPAFVTFAGSSRETALPTQIGSGRPTASLLWDMRGVSPAEIGPTTTAILQGALGVELCLTVLPGVAVPPDPRLRRIELAPDADEAATIRAGIACATGRHLVPVEHRNDVSASSIKTLLSRLAPVDAPDIVLRNIPGSSRLGGRIGIEIQGTVGRIVSISRPLAERALALGPLGESAGFAALGARASSLAGRIAQIVQAPRPADHPEDRHRTIRARTDRISPRRLGSHDRPITVFAADTAAWDAARGLLSGRAGCRIVGPEGWGSWMRSRTEDVLLFDGSALPEAGRSGFLDALFGWLEDPRVGAVCGVVRDPSGALLNAGGVLDHTGTVSWPGPSDHPHGALDVVREVDLPSPGCLALRRTHLCAFVAAAGRHDPDDRAALCLDLRRTLDLATVCTPHARLVSSAARALDVPGTLDPRLREMWQVMVGEDRMQAIEPRRRAAR